MGNFTDQLHRAVPLHGRPRRIVSLVPSQTELLVDLGLKPYLVGVTKFCVHPKNIRRKATVVGGTKRVRFDKIEALRPDIIICNKEENTKEMVAQLEGTAPVWVSDVTSVKGCCEMILALGNIFGVPKKAEEISERILTGAASFLSFMEHRPHKNTAYVIWKDPYMLAGRGTFINELLQLNHFENIVPAGPRYPKVTEAALKTADLVLLSSEPFPFREADVERLKNTIEKEVRLVNGEYFSWYGPRLLGAFGYFRELHGGVNGRG
ncbi:MAG: ABC transporter substrate-binding protein [Marinirhabdus sp.]